MYQFNDLVKPVVMDCNHLCQLDDDYLYSPKLDGVRCLVHLYKHNVEIDYGFEVIKEKNGYEGPEVYMDVEKVRDSFVVLDVLFSGYPLLHHPLEYRMKKVPRGWGAQIYVRASLVSSLPQSEGIVAQRGSSPYGFEVLRIKHRETGDFLVKDGKLYMGMPVPFTFAVTFDPSSYEGKIVEVYLDNRTFFRLREDKCEPNSSVVVARAMTQYRVKMADFLVHLSTISYSHLHYRDSSRVDGYELPEGTYGWHVQQDDELMNVGELSHVYGPDPLPPDMEECEVYTVDGFRDFSTPVVIASIQKKRNRKIKEKEESDLFEKPEKPLYTKKEMARGVVSLQVQRTQKREKKRKMKLLCQQQVLSQSRDALLEDLKDPLIQRDLDRFVMSRSDTPATANFYKVAYYPESNDAFIDAVGRSTSLRPRRYQHMRNKEKVKFIKVR